MNAGVALLLGLMLGLGIGYVASNVIKPSVQNMFFTTSITAALGGTTINGTLNINSTFIPQNVIDPLKTQLLQNQYVQLTTGETIFKQIVVGSDGTFTFTSVAIGTYTIKYLGGQLLGPSQSSSIVIV
jgi:hypothetical protein